MFGVELALPWLVANALPSKTALNLSLPYPQTAVAQRYPIVPMPGSLQPHAGSFDLKGARVLFDSGAKQEAMTFWKRDLAGTAAPRFSTRPGYKAIDFVLKPHSGIPNEGYKLDIKPTGVRIVASTTAGLFYGGVTLDQLKSHGQIPCAAITDAPRFHWRGLLLDVSRHFRPQADIERYLRIMAEHKLNVFHWHLVDDGGWRIQIKKYPELTRRGAWRLKPTTSWGGPILFPVDRQPGEYGGFYTQKQIKQIVAYAEALHITIVPEIEMPGHSLAAVTCYPQLACTNAAGTAAVINSNYCPGKEKTFEFLENVLTEVMAMFPSKYIHIGGDEVDKTTWAQCPDCQARIKSEGLANVEELQSYTIKRIEKFVNSKGRRLIGWDEILEGGLAPSASVMSWRGIDGGLAAARQGHTVVMCPTSNCYFDYPYTSTPVSKVYSYDPIPPGLTAAQQKLVLGGQGNLWTEWIPTRQHLDEMTWPRAAALAEILWTPKSRQSWPNFEERLPAEYARLAAMGVDYMTPTPTAAYSAIIGAGPAVASFAAPPAKGLTLKVRLSDSAPWKKSNGKVTVDKSGKVQAAYFRADGTHGPVGMVDVVVNSQSNTPPESGLSAGLTVEYHEGDFAKVADISGTPAVATEMANQIDISPRKREENYGLIYKGFIKVPSNGDYTFGLSSDDGSVMKLDGATVVDNDGLHGAGFVNGRVKLSKGLHKIEVDYFQAGGAQSLDLTVSGPGITNQPLPSGWLFSYSPVE